ncbi:ABC transporter ATP-binding protein [Brevibacterium sp. 91QC2O2]|uniref:ABC transporter ATP-binding protein n=1 Tax=Brevibacterium TaxID=1696 RepID=UPI00211C85AB|nr:MULTISPECIES: ABC transporter ATP-binding protein [unclassified Brevibacterium]MCQ9367100.1 ABC transporter ATP-binding protein [Brevibacterium sp. 91QC2O2]MCQ9385453.1 ABC transporter ATP-binding protein [Brevibacterium sp. 68QC2CO]
MIRLDDIDVTFPKPGDANEQVHALADLNLEIADREFVCLLGPSGCGKSTALNLIAGFTSPTSGTVTVDGDAVTAPGPDRGVVFQEATIFPWLSVRENVAFGPKLGRGADRSGLHDKVDELLERVGLAGFGDHLPSELSGGMRQRVGLARVLINDPPTLLMDEPFGALDAQTRITMQELLLELWERNRKTVLFVTHDIDEALILGDRVVVMTARPGSIRSIIEVDLPRPRSYDMITDPEYVALRQRLFEELRQEAQRADELMGVTHGGEH